MLEIAKIKKIKHFIYASSSSVYGASTKKIFKETDNVDQPISFYASSKRCNELMAHSYSYIYNFPVTGLRYFSVYGPWGRPDMSLFIFTKKILQDKKENSSSFFDDLKNRKFKLLYLLGSDNLEFQKNDEFIVYQGSHGDRGAEIADLILPSATYTEQNGLYENLEGRIQECKKASYPIGEALEDWKIFNKINKKLGSKDYKVNFDELRKEVLETVPNFSGINELPKKSVTKTNNIETSFFSEKIFVRELDYYYTNSISRSSKTMSECRQIRQKIKKDGTNN